MCRRLKYIARFLTEQAVIPKSIEKGTAECHRAARGADKISLIYVFLQTAALLPATYPLDHAHCRL